jgi:hypothetical protein
MCCPVCGRPAGGTAQITDMRQDGSGVWSWRGFCPKHGEFISGEADRLF